MSKLRPTPRLLTLLLTAALVAPVIPAAAQGFPGKDVAPRRGQRPAQPKDGAIDKDAPPAHDEIAAKVRVGHVRSKLAAGVYETRVNLHNLTRQPVTIDVVAVSQQDGSGKEIRTVGWKNVTVPTSGRPSLILRKGGMVDPDVLRLIRREVVIFNPENPEDYVEEE